MGLSRLETNCLDGGYKNEKNRFFITVSFSSRMCGKEVTKMDVEMYNVMEIHLEKLSCRNKLVV